MQPKPILLDRPHCLVTGMSGSGKSWWLRALAMEEIHARRGIALIEPHGDLSAEVYAGVPRWRKNDVVHIDALDPERCPALNPLQNVRASDRALATSHVIGAFKRLSGTSWGFRTEHILRAAVMAVLETRAPTLLDVERILYDVDFRGWVLRQTKDPRIVRYWTLEFPQYGRLAGEAVAAPANKIAALLASPNVRTILTKTRPRFDARRALDAERIILASTPKRIGDEVTVLGTFLLARLLAGAMSRGDIRREQRKPFTLIVDEFANYGLASLAESAAEGRKFGLRVCAATQSLSTLEPELRASLLSNAGHLVVFRARGEDGEVLARELVRFGPKTLTALDPGERIERIGGRDAVLLGPNDRMPPPRDRSLD